MKALPSRLRGRVEQYNGFQLLCSCGYDINLGFLSYSLPQEAAWSRSE